MPDLPVVPEPVSPEWGRLLGADQHAVANLVPTYLPAGPGVYLWRRASAAVYVGKADSLRSRLGKHRGRGLSLSSSSLRRNVAHALYGLAPSATGKGRQKVTREQSDAIAAWISEMTVAWVECSSKADARELEALLRRQWLPPLNRV